MGIKEREGAGEGESVWTRGGIRISKNQERVNERERDADDGYKPSILGDPDLGWNGLSCALPSAASHLC